MKHLPVPVHMIFDFPGLHLRVVKVRVLELVDEPVIVYVLTMTRPDIKHIDDSRHLTAFLQLAVTV